MASIELEAISGSALRLLCASFVAAACLGAAARATDAATSAATEATATASATATAAGTADESGLSEITVTAERYVSTIQNTAISISALSGDQLIAQGISTVQEITQEVPGLSMRFASPGLTEYEARGLASNGGAAPTVGFYLDEIPLSPPAVSQSGKVVIDPDLYDVQRVEVLRGPQGTLYGSGSMGGTIRVLTNEPKLGTYEGSVQATGSDTQGGSGNGSANLMMNMPIGETLAARVVLSYLYRSGWIDNITIHPFPIALGVPTYTQPLNTVPVTNVYHDANNEQLYGGRLSLLYKPSEDFSILGEAMMQSLHTGGYDLLDGTPTSSQPPAQVYDAHYEAFPLREGIRDDISIFGLTIKANVGIADLTSASSYFGRTGVQVQDASTSIYYTNGGGTPYVPIAYAERDPSHQISQEIRLTSHDIGGFHWVAGAFYSNLNSVWNEISNNPLAATPVVPDGSFFTSWNAYGVRQTAFFTDASYKFTDQWKLSAGVRYYQYKSHQDEYSWGLDGPYFVPQPNSQITHAADSGANPRVDLSYMPNGDLTLYGTVAKGFRPGGANQILPPVTQYPHCTAGALQFGPDSVWNYELGEKARLFDGWLTVNSDVYYIKWLGVQQVFTLQCGYQYYDNAGNGRSFGPEIEIDAKLATDWTATFSGAWTDAKLTQPNSSYTNFLENLVAEPDGVTHPCNAGTKCQVPIMNVVKDTADVSLNYATTVGDYRVTGRAAYAFVGTSYDVAYYFGYKLPSYSLVNARVGLGRGGWDAALFVDNLTNKAALVSANNTSFQFNIPQVVRYSTNQPRTAGIQLNYKF
ncbi:MAG: TonB-dependent receptor [Steroidobacteraceae bacterium]|jgi:outer membrane receptor protein involved in Fe transport